MTTTEPASSADQPPQRRGVTGPWLPLLVIVGDILGTGIDALTRQVGRAVSLPSVAGFVDVQRTQGAA